MKNKPLIEIRTYQESDLELLYKICLLTGDSGKDATEIYSDPKLLGHFYAAPYAIFENELCFIATINNKPAGYILGTKDSKKFREITEKKWFPNLRKQYIMPLESDNSPDAKIIRLIHQGYVLKKELEKYPAHLHIDLLHSIQGKGIGKKIMFSFIDKLKELNVPALHLEVGKSNESAIKFYEKLGFHKLYEYQYSIAFGMQLL